MIIKIILGVVVILVLVIVAFLAKMLYEQSKMHPADTQEILSDIFTIRNSHVNFYLIKSGEKYIAIDAGLSSDTTTDELQKLGISSDNIIAVLLTHTDSDHIGALSLFSNATVYIGSDEIQMIDGTVSRNFFTKNKLDVPYETLSNGETLELFNMKIECIFTPGHTNGSVCYLINGKYLFVGDTLSLQDNEVGLFSSFYNMNNEMQKNSIKRLSELNDIQYIFSGHYGFSDKAVFVSD